MLSRSTDPQVELRRWRRLTINSYRMAAEILCKGGKWEEAAKTARKALELTEICCGRDHESFVIDQQNVEFYETMYESDPPVTKGENEAEKAVDVRQKTATPKAAEKSKATEKPKTIQKKKTKENPVARLLANLY